MKMNLKTPDQFPKSFALGSAKVMIYHQANPSRRLNPDNQKWEKTGKVFDEYVVTYYHGFKEVLDKRTGQAKQLPKLVRRKFADLAKAIREKDFVLTRLANAEGEVLKLSGLDRLAYVDAQQTLRQWNPTARLSLVVADYVAAASRLPSDVTLKEVLNYYLSRHPCGLPKKTVREVVDEMLDAKTDAGRSDVYLKDIRGRLGQFASDFGVPISTVTGKQIADWLSGLGLSGCSQNNHRRLIGTLFKFAIRRGYLPKDHDELSGVEKADASGGEIEVFTPDELKKLFAACNTPVKERGIDRVRLELIPFLAISAFCGLRSAEIMRLDWSEVHLTGPERFIEVKASKAKTASRRIVPISDNCAEWLAPHAQESGPVCPFERMDKQCFQYLAPTAGLTWKRNGLRHSFISYRLAVVKDVGQVSLEAGNSAQMIFKHYRQLVTETQAKEWFAIQPPKGQAGVIIALPDPASATTTAPCTIQPSEIASHSLEVVEPVTVNA